MNIFTKVKQKESIFIENCDELTEAKLWEQHSQIIIWKAKRFSGNPVFYPVYKFKSYYSYSLLALIVYKGYLNLNSKAVKATENNKFTFWGSNETIDSEIVRIGKAHDSNYSISKPHLYAERVVDALHKDIARIEQKNIGYTNVVLCGGKDSLNLLLLPWKNPMIALSANPNYPYVKKFVEDNQLDCDVHCLEDVYDENELEQEILENCCRVDLEHFRWGKGLQLIAQNHNHRLIFWKGQVADLYMSNKWKAFVHPPNFTEEIVRKIYKRTSYLYPNSLKCTIGRKIQPNVIQSTWDRCAAMQGTHMGFIRAITNSLCLSAYHGPSMLSVLSQVDLASAADSDMRHLVGKLLLGKDVIYPSSNPEPPNSSFRSNLYQSKLFIELLKQNNIGIETYNE